MDTEAIKRFGYEHGASIVGVADVEALVNKKVQIDYSVLPEAKSVISIAAAHSSNALDCGNIQLMQSDTIFTYRTADSVAMHMARYLEKNGYKALAVPAFIPIDMSPGKDGMIGLVDHKAIGAEAGVGAFGESGLLVTLEFGPRVRLSSVLTSLELEPTPPLADECCTHCLKCVDSCPSKALSGGGKIDKKKCGGEIFKYGLRGWMRFWKDAAGANKEELDALIRSRNFKELWQNFMTGNYYYCWKCQSACPLGRA